MLEKFACCDTLTEMGDTEQDSSATVTLSDVPKNALKIPFARIKQTTTDAFLESSVSHAHLDDHQLPIHVLAWRSLLASPIDVRAICMSRIMVTGEGSSITGLKSRLIAEIAQLVEQKGWDQVLNYGSASKPVKRYIRNQNIVHTDDSLQPSRAEESSITEPASSSQERDEITEKLTRDAMKGREPPVKAVVRGIESLGPWAGASILTNLRIDAAVEIKKDDFFKQRLSSFGPTI